MMTAKLSPARKSQNLQACRPLVVILSGDGLALYFEHRLANALHACGYSTHVVRALHFFWRRKTPGDIVRMIEAFSASQTGHGAERLVVVGYSFGGAVLPFAYEAMDRTMKEKIAALVLLAPAVRADFKFSIGGWFNIPSSHSRDVEAMLGSLCRGGAPITTVIAENDYPRAQAPMINACRSIKLPGGHGFRHDFKRLARIIDSAANGSN